MMLHHHVLHKMTMTKEDLEELYVSSSLRAFATGIVGVFIPIYLYRQNWRLEDIMFFYMLVFAYSFLTAKLLGIYSSKYGAKHLMAVSFAFSFASLAFLSIDTSVLMVFCLVAPLYALSESAFWISQHIILAETKGSGHVGETVAKFNIFVGLAAAAGPLIGGIVGQHYGLRATFVACLVILFLALWPLFVTRDRLVSGKFNIKKLAQKKEILNDMVIVGTGSIANASIIALWPIFIYKVTGGLIKTGLIVAISLVATTLACWMAGKLNDNKKGRRARKTGSIIAFLAPMIMVISPTVIAVAIGSILGRVAQMLYVVPRSASMISRAESRYKNEYLTAMFMAIQFFKVIFMAVLVLLSGYLSDGQMLNFGLVVGGLMALVYYVNLSPVKRRVK